MTKRADMREACGEAHMKAILATGELGTLRNVARASLVCMMARGGFHQDLDRQGSASTPPCPSP